MAIANFFSEDKIRESAPAMAELTRILEIEGDTPAILTVYFLAIALKGARLNGSDTRFVADVCGGRIDWCVRDPNRGDRLLTAGSFKPDGTPIVEEREGD